MIVNIASTGGFGDVQSLKTSPGKHPQQPIGPSHLVRQFRGTARCREAPLLSQGLSGRTIAARSALATSSRQRRRSVPLAFGCVRRSKLHQRGPQHHTFRLRQKLALAGSICLSGSDPSRFASWRRYLPHVQRKCPANPP